MHCTSSSMAHLLSTSLLEIAGAAHARAIQVLIAAARGETVDKGNAQSCDSTPQSKAILATFYEDEIDNTMFLMGACTRIWLDNQRLVNCLLIGGGATDTDASLMVQTSRLCYEAWFQLTKQWSNRPGLQVDKARFVLHWLKDTTGDFASHSANNSNINEKVQWNIREAALLLHHKKWNDWTILFVHSWIETDSLEIRRNVLSEAVRLLASYLKFDSNSSTVVCTDTAQPTLTFHNDASTELTPDIEAWIYLVTHVVLVAAEYGVAGQVDLDFLTADEIDKIEEIEDLIDANAWTVTSRSLYKMLHKLMIGWLEQLLANTQREQVNREVALEIAQCLCLLTPHQDKAPDIVRVYMGRIMEWNNTMSDSNQSSPSFDALRYNNPSIALEQYCKTDYHLHYLLSAAIANFVQCELATKFRQHSFVDDKNCNPMSSVCVYDESTNDEQPGWVLQAHNLLHRDGFVLLRNAIPNMQSIMHLDVLRQTLATHNLCARMRTDPSSTQATITPDHDCRMSSNVDDELDSLGTVATVVTVSSELSICASDYQLESALPVTLRDSGVLALVQETQSPLRHVLQTLSGEENVHLVRNESYLRCKIKAGFTPPHADYYAYRLNERLFRPMAACNLSSVRLSNMTASENDSARLPDWAQLAGIPVEINRRADACVLCGPYCHPMRSESVASKNGNGGDKYDNDNNDDNGDEFILCDLCECAYHPHCLPRPPAVLPIGEWHCPSCVASNLNVFTTWIPLQALQPQQGVLAVQAGSHKNCDFDEQLGTRFNLPGSFFPLGSLSSTTHNVKWCVPQQLKLGDIIVFNIKTIHASTQNRTCEPRFSADVRFVAGWVHPRMSNQDSADMSIV